MHVCMYIHVCIRICRCVCSICVCVCIYIYIYIYIHSLRLDSEQAASLASALGEHALTRDRDEGSAGIDEHEEGGPGAAEGRYPAA